MSSSLKHFLKLDLFCLFIITLEINKYSKKTVKIKYHLNPTTRKKKKKLPTVKSIHYESIKLLYIKFKFEINIKKKRTVVIME